MSVLEGHMRDSKKQHMPVQCTRRFADAKRLKIVFHYKCTGRAYAELK